MSCHALLAIAIVACQKASAAQLRLAASGSGADDDVVLEYAGLVPVSTTMMCIIVLACQYFFIFAVSHLGRALLSMFQDPGSWSDSAIVRFADGAQNTVSYVPMLCVLFLSCRMRAIQLTYGHTEKYGLPQWWVQIAMQICTFAVYGQLLVILIFPCIFGEVPHTNNDGACTDKGVGQTAGRYCITVVRYFLILFLYGGIITICVGIWIMEAPGAVFVGGTPPVSPAVTCVMLLSVQYFLVYLLIQIVRTYNHCREIRDRNSCCLNLLLLAATTTNLAPMLCILFIAARVRALQMDPLHGHPQWWAQWCFYICTYSAILQTIVVVIVPPIFGGKVVKSPFEGDMTFRFEAAPMSYALSGLRVITLLCLYGGYAGIIVSVFLLEHRRGPAYTPEVSPAMHCVMALSLQFFAIYLVATSVNLVKRLSENDRLWCLQNTLKAAQKTAMIYPMLCISFVALRMRALQMTANRGAPQGWAQDCMYACTWACFFQIVLALIMSCVGPGSESQARSGMPITNYFKVLKIFYGGSQCLLVVITYLAAIGVIIAFFVMTPENANGRGAQLPEH